MSRPNLVLVVVAVLWAVAIGSALFQDGMSEALKTHRLSEGRIPALGVRPDGELQLVPVPFDGKLPPASETWDFYLTDEQLQDMPRSFPGAGEVWVDSLELHNSRRGRTLKLTLIQSRGVVISIYEGGKGKVIPKQGATVADRELVAVRNRAVAGGGVAGLVVFLIFWGVKFVFERNLTRQGSSREASADG